MNRNAHEKWQLTEVCCEGKQTSLGRGLVLSGICNQRSDLMNTIEISD